MRGNVFGFAAASVCLMAAGACAPVAAVGPALDVWAAGDMTQLTDRTPRSDNPLMIDHQGRVSLLCGANETVSFQLVVDAGSTELSGVKLGLGPLTSADGQVIAASELSAYRMLPVTISAFPGWYLRTARQDVSPAGYYDVLVPVDAPKVGQPYALEAGGRLALWVDVRVDRNVKPGQYTGTLTLDADGRVGRSVPLVVQVYDYVLPDARLTPVVGGFDHRTVFRTMVTTDGQPVEPARLDPANPQVRRGLATMRQLMRLAREHRIDLFETTIRPSLRRDVSGRMNIFWQDYDNAVGPYLDGSAFEDRIPSPVWPSPMSDEWPPPAIYGGLESADYRRMLVETLPEYRGHYTSLAAAQRIFHWPCRGGIDPATVARAGKLARALRDADADTAVLSRVPPRLPEETGWIVPPEVGAFADMFAPPSEWLDGNIAQTVNRPDSALKGLWLSTGEPMYLPTLSVLASPADARMLPWFAFRYRCKGVFLPEVLDWRGEPFAPVSDGSARLFYPGSWLGLDVVLPSARLKRLRRGVQDVTCLELLAANQRQAAADSIASAMAHYGGLAARGDNALDVCLDGWVKDPVAWELAHRLIVEEVNAAVHSGQAEGGELLSQRIAWERFNQTTRQVRLERVRASVRPEEDGRSFFLTVAPDLYNELPGPVEVRARLGGLPDGWQPVVLEAGASPLAAGGRKMLTLSARGTTPIVDANGHWPVELILSAGMTNYDPIAVAVPFLQVEQAAQPPQIDAELNEWSVPSGNAAGAFRLLGIRGRQGEGLARRQTRFRVRADKENLYLAVRCEEPNPRGMVVRADNTIHYEQRVACGEDLLEILLDPGADAQGPQDLYHLVIKPNGVVVAEKGVGCQPPLGPCEPWNSAARVAVRTGDNHWIAEIAIPLSSFGGEANRRCWGVNFIRYAAQGEEPSSWSGAARYYYHPGDLGTMLMPVRPNDRPARRAME